MTVRRRSFFIWFSDYGLFDDLGKVDILDVDRIDVTSTDFPAAAVTDRTQHLSSDGQSCRSIDWHYRGIPFSSYAESGAAIMNWINIRGAPPKTWGVVTDCGNGKGGYDAGRAVANFFANSMTR